ncbi:MAG: hypothetical protein J2P25_16045 [Nocardiopsaceae bacterium]|nr:hypothetical protein [Nocardiopsaceae bacterium]
MPRDLMRRPPLRVSALPPNQVSMYPGEPRMVLCPGCQRWLKPHDGGLRRHMVAADGRDMCAESGRRVWFDLTAAEWLISLDVAAREAGQRRGSRIRRKASPPVAPPVFRLAGAR